MFKDQILEVYNIKRAAAPRAMAFKPPATMWPAAPVIWTGAEVVVLVELAPAEVALEVGAVVVPGALVVVSTVAVGVVANVLVVEAETGAMVEEEATVAVAVSEMRTPVREYAAAHWTRDMPSGQHQVPPVESAVQKYPSSQEFPVPSGQQCWLTAGS